MFSRPVIAALGIAVAAGTALAPGALAAGKRATSVVIMDSGVNGSKQYVVGAVCPGDCGSKALNGEKVAVKYFHKTASGWDLVDSTKTKIGAPPIGDGGYAAQLGPVVKSGTCKVSVAYPGDQNYAASKSSAKIDCGSGYRAS